MRSCGCASAEAVSSMWGAGCAAESPGTGLAQAMSVPATLMPASAAVVRASE